MCLATSKLIFTDVGPEFKGSGVNDVLLRFGVKREYSIPFLPHCNGGVEQFNQVMKRRLMLKVKVKR